MLEDYELMRVFLFETKDQYLFKKRKRNGKRFVYFREIKSQRTMTTLPMLGQQHVYTGDAALMSIFLLSHVLPFDTNRS